MIDKQLEKFNPKKILNFSQLNYINKLEVANRCQIISRYKWYNLPNAWDSETVEMALYMYGSLCCFMEDNNIVFANFTPIGPLTQQGKMEYITPITFDGVEHKTLKRCYNKNSEFDFDEDCCIILHDYTPPFTNDKIISRRQLDLSTTINDEVNIYKCMFYDVLFSMKKALMTCDDEDQVNTILKQLSDLFDPTNPFFACKDENILDKINVTTLNQKMEIDNYIKLIEFYNKCRRNDNGIPTEAIFEKNERFLNDEIVERSKRSSLILENGLAEREKFCELANKCFNTQLYVEIAEGL